MVQMPFTIQVARLLHGPRAWLFLLAVVLLSVLAALFLQARRPGQILWHRPLPGIGEVAFGGLDPDGTLYVATTKPSVHALGPDGREHWQCLPPLPSVEGFPRLFDLGPTLVFYSLDKYAVGVSRTAGQVEWTVARDAETTWLPKAPASGPAADLLLRFDNYIYGIRRDGTPCWRRYGLGILQYEGYDELHVPAGGKAGDGLFFCEDSSGDMLIALRPTGEAAWKVPLVASLSGPVVGGELLIFLENGHNFSGDPAPALRAYSFDGRLQWRRPLEPAFVSAPAVTGGLVFCNVYMLSQPEMQLFDLHGQLLARWPSPGTTGSIRPAGPGAVWFTGADFNPGATPDNPLLRSIHAALDTSPSYHAVFLADRLGVRPCGRCPHGADVLYMDAARERLYYADWSGLTAARMED
jgi:hypothetical protein